MSIMVGVARRWGRVLIKSAEALERMEKSTPWWWTRPEPLTEGKRGGLRGLSGGVADSELFGLAGASSGRARSARGAGCRPRCILGPDRVSSGGALDRAIGGRRRRPLG